MEEVGYVAKGPVGGVLSCTCRITVTRVTTMSLSRPGTIADSAAPELSKELLLV